MLCEMGEGRMLYLMHFRYLKNSNSQRPFNKKYIFSCIIYVACVKSRLFYRNITSFKHHLTLKPIKMLDSTIGLK